MPPSPSPTPSEAPSFQQHTHTQTRTHLRGGKALLGQLAHVLRDLLRGDLEPRGRAPLVGEGRLRDTLTSAVHATHLLEPTIPQNKTKPNQSKSKPSQVEPGWGKSGHVESSPSASHRVEQADTNRWVRTVDTAQRKRTADPPPPPPKSPKQQRQAELSPVSRRRIIAT